MGMQDDNIQAVVSAWIQQREKTLDALVKQRRGLDEEIERVRQSLIDVVPFAETLGIPVTSQDIEDVAPRNTRSSRVPPRTPQYANLSLLEASKRLLRQRQDRKLHADQIVRSLFFATSPAEMKAAKSSLVPTLSAAVNTGELRRVAPNTFQLVDTEGEHVAVNDEAPP